MINQFFNKTISIFLTMVILFGLFPTAVFAQEELKGINRSVFDSHFSRADREIDPERWLAEAKMGLSQAINTWELTADSIYENPHELIEARKNLEDWSNSELEKRFSKWLSNRFFGKPAEKAIMEYSAYLNEAHNENLTLRLYSELIAYVPIELQSSMSKIIYETASERSNAIKNEFENIAARDERILFSRNIKNFLNLRNQKEIDEARIFTERLISEAEAVCSIGIEEIKTKIEQASANAGDLALMGEEWLNLYKEQFERGLKAWEEAEERFFVKRIEWEQESLNLFSEGHNVWTSAYDQLNQEQQKWELQAKLLLEEGSEIFNNISVELTNSINTAREEFKQNMSLRLAEGIIRTNTLIDIYLLSISSAIFARDNEDLVDSDMYSICMDNAQDAINKILSDHIELLSSAELTSIINQDVSSDEFFLDEYQIALIRAKSLVSYWERKITIENAVINYSSELAAGRTSEEIRKNAWENAKFFYNEYLNAYELEMNKLSEIGTTLQNQQIILIYLAEIINNTEAILTEKDKEDYLSAVEEFISLGFLYDVQYSKVKLAYEEMNNKRHDYEKHDAIKRWASTNYIDIDLSNLEIYTENLTKANAVLSVLGDLYSNETARTYKDPLCDILYSAYQQKYDIKLKILEVENIILSDIERESINNYLQYVYYMDAIKSLGNIDTKYYTYTILEEGGEKIRINYESPSNFNDLSIKDIIKIDEKGRIVFNRNNMTLSTLNEADVNNLINYFEEKHKPYEEFQETTEYEMALRGLAERMSVYFTDPNKYRTWGLARDYLITSLISYNSEMEFLSKYYIGAGEFRNGGSSLSNIQIMYDWHSNKHNLSYKLGLDSSFKIEDDFTSAWNKLSDEEKADLEFYVILTLSGGKNLEGFSQYYTLDVYTKAYNYVNGLYSRADRKVANWRNDAIGAAAFTDMKEVNRIALNRITPTYNETKDIVALYQNNLDKTLSSIKNNAAAFAASTERLKILIDQRELENAEQDSKILNIIVWNDLKTELLSANKFNDENILELQSFWDAMRNTNNKNFYSIQEAFSALIIWAWNEEMEAQEALNNYWNDIRKNQHLNEQNFQNAINNYMTGTITIDELKESAETAYGENTISEKYYLDTMYSFTFNNLSSYIDMNIDFTQYFKDVGKNLTYLTEMTIKSRYFAELEAREIEWDLMYHDLYEKYNEWLNTSILILERGRNDWTAGKQRIESSHNAWLTNFQNEFNRVSNEWNEAYLAGLEDKELWLERTSNAANQASSEAFLSLIGAEGERLSRFMDIREPMGIRNMDIEAQSIMNDLLQSSGIVNMASALGSLNNITNTASSKIQGGMSGISWNKAEYRITATEIAKTTNEKIATAEIKRIARNVRLQADDAVEQITANVNDANQNFRDSMDNLFLIKHQWNRNGNDYIKEVVKGSTLFEPVITQKATIKGYKDYILDQIILTTKLDDEHILTLDSIAVKNLLENVMSEVTAIYGRIFGNNEEPIGEFTAHIGEATIDEEATETKEAYYKEGYGELNRLIEELKHWYSIDAMGMAELGMASWEKRMWDDSDSLFDAPSIKLVGTIAAAVVGTVVSIVATPFTGGASFLGVLASASMVAGITASNEILFAAMDVSYGYKSFDEAAFDVGKSTLISFAGGLIGGGISSVVSTIKTASTIANVALTGLTNAAGNYATSVTMSYINAYDFKTGEYDWQAANSSWYDVKTITGAVGAGIGSGLSTLFGSTSIISTPQQKYWSGALSLASAGSAELTKYGVYTAYNLGDGLSLEKSLKKAYDDMGGITINIANLGAIFDFVTSSVARNNSTGQLANSTEGIQQAMKIRNALNKTGILEMNFGSNGITANFGTGGIDVGGALYDLTKRGIDYAQMVRIQDKETRETALTAYGWGDWTAENTAIRIASGLDQLVFEKNLDGNGYTTASSTTKGRIISLNGKAATDMNAVHLQHEAYRDGIVTNDNYLETRIATLAHTQMADKMSKEGQLTLDKYLKRDILALSQGTEFFNAYVDSIYDSSEDFWKLTKDGKLLYDGRADLYDEEGRLIASAGTNSLSTSLGKWMGVTQNEAMAIMRRNYGMTYTNGQGWSAPTNTNYGAYALPQYQAQYEIQWKYIDQVSTVYNGSMEAAINAMYNDARNMVSTFNQNANLAKLTLMINSYSNLMEFARGYDSFIYGNNESGQTGALNTQRYTQYTSTEAQIAYSEVIRDLQNRNYTDSNSLYTHYAIGGILFNIVADNVFTSTKSHYSNGNPHRFGINKDGLSIDTAGVSITEQPIYTTQYEVILNIKDTGSIDYGMQIWTQTASATHIYAHLLQEHRNSSTTLGQLSNLWDLSKSSGIYALTLPPGTMIGRVGNSGNSTGPHLHYEMRVRY